LEGGRGEDYPTKIHSPIKNHPHLSLIHTFSLTLKSKTTPLLETPTAIQVTNLSKRYTIGQQTSGNLREALGNIVRKTTKSKTADFWALKAVSFEIKQGEVVGIVGKNGAGKSTLLKILSQITRPTEGRIELMGRVASLLEVGTGFHPELTGRENIYLNGTILGMTRKEVKDKFDEIVAFSGVQQFIDTPVKHYSSGMYVRLAFAVAAHLDPEILIIDEVLAVGDAEFQAKCMGKMRDVANTGRTVLFVSHNLASVKTLCDKAILLRNGHVAKIGATDEVVAEYLSGEQGIQQVQHIQLENEGFTLEKIAIRSADKTFEDPISRQNPIWLELDYTNHHADPISFTIKFKAQDGIEFLMTSSAYQQSNLKEGKQQVKLEIPEMFLNEGNYFIDCLVVKNRKVAIIFEKDILSFTVTPEKREIGSWMGKEQSYIVSPLTWSHS
jgi:lipopolysaccharide transport system ATP-binding protein